MRSQNHRLSILILLSLLTITACRSGDSVMVDQPTLAELQPAAAQASAAPLTPNTSPAATSASLCSSGPPQLSFEVYANNREWDFSAGGISYDRSQPLANAMVSVNGLALRTDSQGRVSLPHPVVGDVRIRVQSPGYDSYDDQYAQFMPTAFTTAGQTACSSFYVALSPLSDEELHASPIPFAWNWFDSQAPGMHYNQATGFSYAVLKTPQDLERLRTGLKSFVSDLPDEPGSLWNTLAKGLAAGQQAVLFSNGSKGNGDVHPLIARASRQGDKLILASHNNILMSEDVSGISAGMRDALQTEVVLIPADIRTLVFDALLPGSSGFKKRLEVSTADAVLK